MEGWKERGPLLLFNPLWPHKDSKGMKGMEGAWASFTVKSSLASQDRKGMKGMEERGLLLLFNPL